MGIVMCVDYFLRKNRFPVRFLKILILNIMLKMVRKRLLNFMKVAFSCFSFLHCGF